MHDCGHPAKRNHLQPDSGKDLPSGEANDILILFEIPYTGVPERERGLNSVASPVKSRHSPACCDSQNSDPCLASPASCSMAGRIRASAEKGEPP
jgi:hypothetical protein